MTKQPESYILGQIRDYLRARGWTRIYRIQQGMGCHKGICDLIAVHRGRVLFIEVKTPTGRLSEYQKVFGDEITEEGCEYIVARSFEDLKAAGV